MKRSRTENRPGKHLLSIVLLLLPLLCACSTTVQRTPADPSTLKKFDPSVDRKQALANLEEAELNRRGKDFLHQGNYQLASLHYSVALAKNADSPAALTGLGEVLLARGDYAKAREAFAKGLEKDLEHFPALLGMARTCRKQGDPEAALSDLERVLAAHPESIEALTELALTYEALGKELLAEPLYVKVVELEPHKAAGYNNLGFNYLLQGRYPEAVATLSRGMSLEAPTQRLQNNLAVAYALNGETEKARRLFEKNLGKASAYNNIGYIQLVQGKWDQAEISFRQALELKPTFYTRARENLDRLSRMRSESVAH